MASKSVSSRPLPRLYLALPALDDISPSSWPWLESLPGLLKAADIAAVLVRLKPSDPRSMISRIKALAPAIQNSGAALLLDGEPDLVARAGADGAHLTGIAAMQEALPVLKPDRIAGVGGLATRHESMAAGEAGADYVLFGEPDAHGERPSQEAIAERLQWWAELFEPPCVGYVTSREDVDAFVLAGADFILVDDLVWSDPRGPAVALADIGQAIGTTFASTREHHRGDKGHQSDKGPASSR